MNFREKIERGLFSKKHNQDPIKVYHELSFLLAKEFGWSYQEINEAPIPFVIGLLHEYQDFKKREEALMKKK